MYGGIFDDDKEEFFDALCFGEGELPLEELIKSSYSKAYQRALKKHAYSSESNR